MDESLLKIVLPSGKSCNIDIAETDFPDPDSPTSAIVSFLFISKEAPSTAVKIESLTLKPTVRFFTSNKLLISFFLFP